MTQHITEDDIELFILGRVSAEESVSIAAHLSACPLCLAQYETTRDFVTAIQSALQAEKHQQMEVHQTTDGPIRLELWSNNQVWVATLRGQYHSSGTFALSQEQAEIDIRTIFEQLFPEHQCTSACRQRIYSVGIVS